MKFDPTLLIQPLRRYGQIFIARWCYRGFTVHGSHLAKEHM